MNSLPDECIHKTVAAFKNIPERSGESSRFHCMLSANGLIGSLVVRDCCWSHRRCRPGELLLPCFSSFRSVSSRCYVRSRSLSHQRFAHAAVTSHQWKAASDDDLWTNAARNWIDSTISPHSPGGSYPCFLESREGLAKIRNTFGPTNWARLVDIKKQVDPQGLIENCFWPKPEDGEDASCTLCDE